jgi:hypothetical protein
MLFVIFKHGINLSDDPICLIIIVSAFWPKTNFAKQETIRINFQNFRFHSFSLKGEEIYRIESQALLLVQKYHQHFHYYQ